MPVAGHDAPSSEHIVATVSIPGAGPSYSVRALTAALARLGARVGLHTVSGRDDDCEVGHAGPDVTHTVHRRDFGSVPVLSTVFLSNDLHCGLKQSARETDVLHGHGLWLMPNIYPAWATRAGGAKLVVSPRGMLGSAALAFSRRRKSVFWRLFQENALRQAACLHATSEAEHADIRAVGLTNPVAVIPNGVDLPEPGSSNPTEGPRTILSLGRIHPKKGLDQLVRAWALVEAEAQDWRLRIIGPAELGHDRELRGLCEKLGVLRAAIEGPLFGDDKLAAFRQAELFVLPTLNENFAMTVAEALAAGVPVISTKGAPWARLEGEGSGWWVDHGPESLAAALRQAITMPPEALRSMGARGRAWMARDFSWDQVAREMLDVYGWLTRGSDRPAFVRLD